MLAGLNILALVTLAGGFCSAIATGGDAARLTVRNETPWPLNVEATSTELISPGDEPKFVAAGGPGWFTGVILDVSIDAGPELESRLFIEDINGEDLVVTVSVAGASLKVDSESP